MTKAEILALPLDKLNELVAEKVMSHEIWKSSGWAKGQWPPGWDYSGDIKAAWQVQEKMFEREYKVKLVRLETAWSCCFGRRGSEFPDYSWIDHQPSAPEAICRAALLVVSGEIEEGDMFGKKQRLMRVEVLLKHGEGEHYPDIKEIILVNPGESFSVGFGWDTIKHGNAIVRQFNWRAGYTVVYEYFYQ